ncbi:MAG: OmpA family protein [bacterium]|nr:OmpA family protein [bacterium]
MFELRTIIAVVSLLSGTTLLLIGTLRVIRRVPVFEKSAKLDAVLVYGSLFVAAGILLMFRGGDTEPTATVPEVKAPVIAQQSPEDAVAPDTGTISSGIRTSKRADLPMERDLVHDRAQKTLADRHDLKAVAPIPQRRHLSAPQARDIPPPTKTTYHPGTVEDRMYLAVSRVFDSVEDWFMKYGSPAPNHADTRTDGEEAGAETMDSDLQFPAIAFESGTADLQPQSVDALKNLAERLRSLPTPITVEIQARVDSLGPEPFNYLLTKARVETVCDVLTQEGVDTHRLIARALGSQHDGSTKTGAQIQFVLCP